MPGWHADWNSVACKKKKKEKEKVSTSNEKVALFSRMRDNEAYQICEMSRCPLARNFFSIRSILSRAKSSRGAALKIFVSGKRNYFYVARVISNGVYRSSILSYTCCYNDTITKNYDFTGRKTRFRNGLRAWYWRKLDYQFSINYDCIDSNF